MNLIKVMALVIVGAILGYSFSFIGKASNEEDLKQTIPIPSPSKALTIKETSTVNKHNFIAQKCQESEQNHEITKSNDEGKLNQKYLTLRDEHQVLKDKYFKAHSEIRTLTHQLDELESNEATDEEMEQLVPEPFKSFLSSFRGRTRNDIYEFHTKEDQEEENIDWGYNTKNNISDFILTHYESTSVKLISVSCKQPHCEILATEMQEGAWGKIMKDIHKQPWWKFSSTSSSSDNEFIYTFLSQ
jgi:hypothetical protein